MIEDVTQLVQEADEIRQREIKRRNLSLQLKSQTDIELPALRYWNYLPCAFHEVPTPGCEYRQCGGHLFKHQRVGVAWLYAVKRGILADMTGLGKTNQIIALACLLKQQDELTGRMVVVCQASAVGQWVEEFNRFAPRLRVIPAVGVKNDRLERYAENWDVCVMSANIMLRDQDILRAIEPAVYVADDVDPIRNSKNKTTQAYNKLTRHADRVININATPLQIRLEEMYSTAMSVGGYELFGGFRKFERRYMRIEPVTTYNGKTGRKFVQTKVVGYKNMSEFKSILAPLYLRRTYDDIDDIAIPAVAPPENVWLDLHPAQRLKYTELQEGVLKLITEEGEKVKHIEAITKFNYGAMVCASLTALDEPDGPQASVKLDWLLDKLTGDWVDQKVVVFSRFKGTIRALGTRLRDANIGMALIWGDMPQERRQAQQKRFWDHPQCRVIVGTSAIERSLNLQVSNIVVNLDTLLNPARMTQILGRIRRVGSTHSHVYVFNLLTRETQEERYLEVLQQRQALADYVFDESSELYESLSSLELLSLITP